MCSVLPFKKRQLKEALPLDLSLKKKNDYPECASTASQSVPSPFSPPTVHPSGDLQLHIQLALLSQHLYLNFLAAARDKVADNAPVAKKSAEERRASRSGVIGDERRYEANARERSRVQNLGAQFERLRELLPVEDLRLSKLTILRIAKAYIGYLAVLATSDNDEEMVKSATDFQATAYQEMQPRR